MLKQFNKKDIDTIMKIWKDNNQKFQSFIDNQYWVDNYVKTRDEFLNNKIYVYTEVTQVLAFIVVSNDGRLVNIQVKPEIQREGIGKLLLEKVKNENNNLHLNVYEKNISGVLFFKAMGFRKASENVEEDTNEVAYNMTWSKSDELASTFIYFDNSISEDLIEKYDKLNKIQFYDVHTFTKDVNNTYGVDVSSHIEKKNDVISITDYIEVRNKLNSIIKNKEVIIYFDCNNDYSYLFNVIKDVIKVKGIDLTIVMHKPFSVEGSKKVRIYENVKKNFEGYNVVDVNYEAIGKNRNVTFKDAFDMRDEELLKMICGSI